MRDYILLFAIIITLFKVNAGFAQAPNAQNLYKISNINGIKLREVPAANGQYIISIASNEPVVLLTKLQNDWCKIRYNGRVGFTLYEYIKKVETPVDSTKKTTQLTKGPDEENDKSDKGRKRKKKH